MHGDAEWPNLSKYIFITGSAEINEGSLAKTLVPYGHAAALFPMTCSIKNAASTHFPENTFTTTQVSATTNQFDSSISEFVVFSIGNSPFYCSIKCRPAAS